MTLSSLALRTALAFSALTVIQSERVPAAAVVNGVPQGIFFARSLLTGRAVCLLFLSGGRVTRFIPTGGLENLDWEKHRASHAPDVGRWEVAAGGGQLRITWGDGGVHEGPVTVHADGIEFYGKRYQKPATAALAQIAGVWEATRGTAIAGGQGVNRASTLVIQPDGRYSWASTTGGVVAGRASAASNAAAGTVVVSGATLILRSDSGAGTSHTFLASAGSPLQAFTLDGDLFTRVR